MSELSNTIHNTLLFMISVAVVALFTIVYAVLWGHITVVGFTSLSGWNQVGFLAASVYWLFLFLLTVAWALSTYKGWKET